MIQMIKSLFGNKDSKQPACSTGGAYTVDDQDKVHLLTDVPQSSVGAPNPVIIASEHNLFVAFYGDRSEPKWDGKSCRVVSPDTISEPVVVVRFNRVKAHFFGPPNDEAFNGHPLYSRGLQPYGAFEVLSSSWIRALERMNSVHPRHSHQLFSDYRHLILSFHDSIFECIAHGYTLEYPSGSLRSIASSLALSL